MWFKIFKIFLLIIVLSISIFFGFLFPQIVSAGFEKILRDPGTLYIFCLISSGLFFGIFTLILIINQLRNLKNDLNFFNISRSFSSICQILFAVILLNWAGFMIFRVYEDSKRTLGEPTSPEESFWLKIIIIGLILLALLFLVDVFISRIKSSQRLRKIDINLFGSENIEP